MYNEMNYMNPYYLNNYQFFERNTDIFERDSLKEKMRKLWEQHVFWTRLVIISIIDRLKDEQDMTERLLRNPKDIANLYLPFYGKDVAETINKLITDHLVIASNLVHAIMNNQNKEVTDYNKKWYKNADEIAYTLSSINKYYDEQTLRKMLHEHLDLTKEEVMNRRNGNHQKEIEIFDKIENQALMMADYFTEGISKQFMTN